MQPAKENELVAIKVMHGSRLLLNYANSRCGSNVLRKARSDVLTAEKPRGHVALAKGKANVKTFRLVATIESEATQAALSRRA